MTVTRPLLPALVFALFHAAAAQQAPPPRNACDDAGKITLKLTEISGLKLRKPVPCDYISKEKVKAFLDKRIREVASSEDIRAEELTLKKFGLVPPDFQLAKTTIDLLTEQAAAFYDYEKRKLFITETTAIESQEPVLAHELSHALADQNFDLKRFIKKGRESDDGSAARLAVMEGQATWLMSEYMARSLGQSLKNSPQLLSLMSGMSESSAGGQYPIFENAPLYLRRTLIFPYTRGMLFQHSVLQRNGDGGFAEVFRNPPVSTQQIAHPEKYFSGVKPTEPQLPEPRLARGYKSLVGGMLGELEHSILIQQFGGEEQAAELAPHWRGSTFEIRENKKQGRAVLLYAVEWDSEESARQYFAFYKTSLGKKWKRFAVASENAGLITGEGDDGRFELRLQGAVVSSMEGLPPAIN